MLKLNFFKYLIFTTVIISSILIYIHLPGSTCQQFSIQAQSFINGKLDIPKSIDTVYKTGKYYWPQGPFSSIILIPFQLVFGPSFNQSVMQPFLVIILIILLYKLARLKKFQTGSALLLTFAFLFSSQTAGVITESCYSFFAHVVTMVLLTALLLEFESKKRPLILGVLISTIILTRPSAAVILLPIIYFLFSEKHASTKLLHLLFFTVPLAISIIFLLWFNQARFQNPLDNGYSSNDVGSYLNELRSEGVFSLKHIPSNFYYYFLISVQPIIKESTNLVFPFFTYNPLGLSFFIVSPFFLYAFKSLWSKNTLIKLYWLVTLVTLIILLSYYTTGWVQFGPRFLSDIMPILYLLLLNSLNPPKLSIKHQVIILLSSLINTYLLLTGFFIFKK